MRIIDKDEIERIEPHAGGKFAMLVPSSGILDPMAYTIALAENAAQNGVRFFFGRRVTAIERFIANNCYLVHTPQGSFRTKLIVNCAGAYASQISEMLGYPNYPVRGFKGEYFVLDKKAGAYLKVPVYPAPNDKGGFSTHATPTVDVNILVGPDSYVTEEPEDYKVTKEHLDGRVRDGSKMFKQMRREFYIRNFAGIRWKRIDPETGAVLDFKLESDQEHNPNTVNLVGIESPGITCAGPLARRAVARLVEVEKPAVNEGFDPVRPAPKRFYDMTREEQAAAVAADPEYGEVVCRCENVTRAEMVQIKLRAEDLNQTDDLEVRVSC